MEIKCSVATLALGKKRNGTKLIRNFVPKFRIR